MIEKQISEDEADQRLDKYVRKQLREVPLSHIFKMFRTKKIRVNGVRGYPEQLLKPNDLVAIRGDNERLLARLESSKNSPKPRLSRQPLQVIYQDSYLMAVNKPAGMAVHPGSGISEGTLVDEVRALLGPQAIPNEFAPSPAHRLDRDTSGVILVAKRRKAMVRLTEIFTQGSANKTYLTVVRGHFTQATGTVDLPLSEHEQSSKSKAKRGINMQPAVTHYCVLATGTEVSLLKCTIETGRTHQIRRHLVAIGHPVAGDRRHGDFAFNRVLKSKYGLKRMFLHAQRIELVHPIENTTLILDAPLPFELTQALQKMDIPLPK